MYDPTIGRWLSEDPKGFEAGDANLYRYVKNDATNLTDPSGLQAGMPGPHCVGAYPEFTPFPDNTVSANRSQGILGSISFLLFTYNRQTLLNGIPVLSPNNNNITVRVPPAGSAIELGGSGRNWGGVLPQGRYVSVSGCGPCVGLILYKDSRSPTYAFHFSATDNVGNTIGLRTRWAQLNGYRAFICGAETQNDAEGANQSAGTLSDVLGYLGGHGVTDISYIPAPGMAIDSQGNPYWIFPDNLNFPLYAP